MQKSFITKYCLYKLWKQNGMALYNITVVPEACDVMLSPK